MDARTLVLARHIDLVGRSLREVDGARDVFKRELAAFYAARHASILEDNLAREARAARGFWRDVRDVPCAIIAALDRRLGARDRYGLDGRGRIVLEPERRKQAQVHLGLGGPDDALRLLVINCDIAECGVMKRRDFHGADLRLRAELVRQRGRNRPRCALHESAGLDVVPGTGTDEEHEGCGDAAEETDRLAMHLLHDSPTSFFH